jgi:4-amino-4-deoxy-L-arabinose transferase-like glycosyltransferase
MPAATEAAGGALLPRPWLVALWAAVGLVLAAGLLFPDLNYSDAPQYAVIALRMFREHDWVNLVSTGKGDYLDKPHLLFWSALAGFHLLGVHDWSYRLGSVLVSVLGALAVGRLGRRLYGPRAGQLAALAFITAETILLGASDVRTDALLTGFTALGTWLLVRWVDEGDLPSILGGAAAMGLAVSSKGMVAVAVAAPCLVLYALGRGRLDRLRSPQLLLGLLAFALAMGPVLLAYALQFDLHPEKEVLGQTGVSGVRFFLWDQSTRRFGGGEGQAAAGDHLFFFHSLLWVLLPWSLLLYAAWGRRLWALVRGGLAAFRAVEQLTFLWPLAFITLLNFSSFKLPHYLNVFVPVLAVLVAAYLEALAREGRGRALTVLARLQAAVVAALLLGGAVLCGWCFPLRSWWVVALAAPLVLLLVLSFRLRDPVQRVWVPSAVAVLLVNLVLDASFFPQLARYQPGSAFARQALALGMDPDRTWFLDELYRPFQFYAGREIQLTSVPELAREAASGRPTFALVGEKGLRAVEEAGVPWRELASSPDCRITMLTRALLDPRTREGACPRAHLLALGR